MNAIGDLSFLHTLLLNALVRTTLLLLLAWIASRCFPRIGAARQHFLWLFALLGVVYVTGVSLLVSAGSAFRVTSVPTLPLRVWHAPDVKRVPFTPTMSREVAVTASSATLPATLPTTAIVQRGIGFNDNSKGMLWIAALWLFGSLAMLARMARSRRAVQKLKRHSRLLENTAIQAMLAQVAARLGVTRLPILLTLQSEKGAFSPLTWGWRSTFLMFPADVETWSDERVEAVLLHELAHIQRRDWLTQRMADAVCVLYWFHPLVWIAAKNLRACAERACDDMALTNGITPDAYARQLLDIAQTLRPYSLAPQTTLPFLHDSQLETRLRAILDGTISRRAFSQVGRRALLGMGALCLMPLALALPVTTQTVNFVSAEAVPAANGKVTLPGGVTVELLGITNFDRSTKSKPQVWWKPDGTPLAAPLYTPTVAEKVFKRGKSSLLGPILTFSLKVSGITDTQPSLTQAFITDSLMTGGTINRIVPHDASYILYEVQVDFTKLPSTTSLRFKIAQKPWQTIATAATLPATVHATDGTSFHFGKPDKIEAGIVKINGYKKFSEAAVIVRATNNQTVSDAARRVAIIDDQGKTIPLDSSMQLSYTREQKGQEELHILLAVPETLRGHIRQYQLQTRPYQYADFPNIHLKPNAEKQPHTFSIGARF